MSQVKIQTGLKLLNLTKNSLGGIGSIVLSERFNYNLKLSELLYIYTIQKKEIVIFVTDQQYYFCKNCKTLNITHVPAIAKKCNRPI